MDLSLATTEELVKELLNRHDHACFVGMKVLSVQSGDPKQDCKMYFIRRFEGNSHTCMGLLDDLKVSIMDEFQTREEPATGEAP